MALSKPTNFEHAQSAVPCDICEDETAGENYCIECKQTLCTQCEKVHRKVASSRDHKVILRIQVGDIDTTALTCTDHGVQASFHCDKCDIHVCTKCVTGKHKGHDMSDLADILDKEKTIMQDEVKAMKTALPSLKYKKEDIQTKKKAYKQKIQKIRKEMEDENQTFIKDLQKMHRKRIDDISNIEQSDLVTFDNLAEEIDSKIDLYEKRIPECVKVIAMNNLAALRTVAKGKVSPKQIEIKKEYPEPPVFIHGSLRSFTESVGKLLVPFSEPMTEIKMISSPTAISKFKCPLGGFPRLCITKEDKCWLGGRDSRTLVLVNVNGQVTRRRKMKNRPYSLAVTDTDEIIMSPHENDSWSVFKLLRDGKEQTIYDAVPYGSTAIYVTLDQKLLICRKDGRVVKTNADGSDVKDIYTGSGILTTLHAVENSDGDTYISDWKNHALVVVRRNSTIISTITLTTDGQKIGRPQGLARDKMGNILFAGYDNNCVYVIDHKQEIRELVGPSFGIQGPRWLSVDSDSNLWITQDDGTIHVVRYLSS